MAEYDRKDHLYEKAKAEGYRSRAAYKLIELDKKYNLLFSGAAVLDLGCWPGGWLQVAAGRVGPAGLVVGIDLAETEAIEAKTPVHLLVGDARDESSLESMRTLAPEGYSVVLSDMSPKLTGIKEADQAGIVGCAELAFWLAQQVLRPGGHLVMKFFKGNEAETFIRSLRPHFERVARSELDATRKTSNEFYAICLGYRAE